MTLEEADEIVKHNFGNNWLNTDYAEGKAFEAICTCATDYERDMTRGNIYQIKMIGRILPCNPLCSLKGNTDRRATCHADRFVKIREIT